MGRRVSLYDGPLSCALLILMGSVLWAPIWYVVYSWHVLGSRLGAHHRIYSGILGDLRHVEPNREGPVAWLWSRES